MFDRRSADRRRNVVYRVGLQALTKVRGLQLVNNKPIRSNLRLHIPGYPAQRQVGPFVFLSGLSGLNADGEAVRSYAELDTPAPFPALGMAAPDSWEQSAVSQASVMYDGLKEALAADGGKVLFYGIYVKDIRDYPSLVRARSAKFEDGISPPCTCSQVPGLPFAGSVVCFDAAGFLPNDRYPAQSFQVVDSASPGTGKMANYQLATRVGPYLFLAGVVAPEAAVAPFRFNSALGLARAALEASASTQTAAICSTLRTLLEEQGGGLNDLAKINIYLTNMRDLPAVENVLHDYFGAHLPAATVIEVKSLARGDFTVEIEGVAYVGEKDAEPDLPFSLTTNWGLNPSARVCGDLIYISGLLPWDRELGKLIENPSELGLAGQSLVDSTLTVYEHARPELRKTAAQTWHIVNQIQRGVQPFGGLHKLAKLTVYLRDIRTFPAFDRVLQHMIEAENRPALTVFQPSALPLRGVEVMIEAIAER
jgi:2-iminobutanoate/2-iminopropanoate deaminase